jgi:hypothetical protein
MMAARSASTQTPKITNAIPVLVFMARTVRDRVAGAASPLCPRREPRRRGGQPWGRGHGMSMSTFPTADSCTAAWAPAASSSP